MNLLKNIGEKNTTIFIMTSGYNCTALIRGERSNEHTN
jgi:hypothetical protein